MLHQFCDMKQNNISCTGGVSRDDGAQLDWIWPPDLKGTLDIELGLNTASRRKHYGGDLQRF